MGESCVSSRVCYARAKKSRLPKSLEAAKHTIWMSIKPTGENLGVSSRSIYVPPVSFHKKVSSSAVSWTFWRIETPELCPA